MTVRVDVEADGPLWNGRAIFMLARTTDDVERDAARHAEDLVQARLHTVLRRPTGHYQSTVHVVYASDPYVDGEGTVYGRWLEGTGSRNATTRFKGYHTFRLMGQRAERDAGPIADRHIDRLARMI